MLINDFKDYIVTHRLLTCDACVVGVSGGPDSMCLLDLLVSMRDQCNNVRLFPVIIAVHVHHGLRGKEADEDLVCVQNYCEKANVPLHITHEDVSAISNQEGISIEHAGRKIRHAFFEKIANQYASEHPNVRIALAHQREDKAETMMMNLFRGSGLDGLCAMPVHSGRIIRPLLFASKEQILSYLENEIIAFRYDQSNDSDIFSRNVWRNRVFPILRSVSIKDPVDALVDLSEHLSKDKDYIDTQALATLNEQSVIVREDHPGLSCTFLSNQHPAIAGRLVRMLYERSFLDMMDLTADQVKAILQGVNTGKSNLSFSLSKGKVARIEANILYFEKQRADIHLNREHSFDFAGQRFFLFLNEDTQWTPDDNDIHDMHSRVYFSKLINIEGLKLSIERIEKPSQVVYNSRVWYCPLDFFDDLTVRTPQPKDRISRAGSDGSKLLRRYLTDSKIPSDIRSRLILFALGDKVLWIPGMIHAEGFINATSHEKFLCANNNTNKPIQGHTDLVKFEIIELDI